MIVAILYGYTMALIPILLLMSFAFLLLTFDLDINHQTNIGTNQVSIHYVEKITSTDGSSFGLPSSSDYPFGQVFLQYEHTLVTVDNDCRMIRWDQHGDNKEQKDVDDIATAILCSVGFLPCVVVCIMIW